MLDWTDFHPLAKILALIGTFFLMVQWTGFWTTLLPVPSCISGQHILVYRIKTVVSGFMVL